MGPLIWYVNAQVRMWIILDINYKHYYHLGKSQICAGAGDYFRTSKPHSEKLWLETYRVIVSTDTKTFHSVPECGFEVLKTYQAPAHIWDCVIEVIIIDI